MQPEIIYTIVGQIALIGLVFRWLHVQVRDNKQNVEKMMKDNYTKIETKDLIELMIKPIEVGISHVQDDVKEIKDLLNRLLNEKDK